MGSWREVRVFISSTFRDMHAERDHLVRFVFPRLRDTLLPRRVRLVDVDLRWGVIENDDAREVCRVVIDECRPRFIGLLGGRYGTVLPGQTLSVTADEVHYGAIEHAGCVEAFFYTRDEQATASVPEDLRADYLDPAGSAGAEGLGALRSAIADAGYAAYVYPARWDAERARFVELEDFGERVYGDLLASITAEFGEPDAGDEEGAAQEQFVVDRAAGFVGSGRLAMLDDLLAWATGDGPPTRGVVGESGLGKSALLAQLCRQLDESGVRCIRHFVGASAGSTSLRASLRRLCHMLGEDKPGDGIDELQQCLEHLLHTVPCGAPSRTVLIIDGLDQMDPADGAWSLGWLPRLAGGNARILASAASGHATADALERRVDSLDRLGPFTDADAEQMFDQHHERYRQQLSAAQRTALMAKAEGDRPLYLSVALAQLRTFGRFETLSAQIAALPGTIDGLFSWLLGERLAHDPGLVDDGGRLCGDVLVPRLIGALLASRSGLSQAELTAACQPEDPNGNVAAIVRWLRPYLLLRGAEYDFAHRQLRSAAERLKPAEQDDHRRLAACFVGMGSGSPRGVSERAYHLAKAGEWSGLVSALTDFEALETKCVAGGAFDLADDLARAWQALPLEHTWRDNLRLLEEALRRHLLFIDRHRQDYPQALLQCLWNEAWWYDAPAARTHYDEAEREGKSVPVVWERPEPRLCTLLERWREERALRAPGQAWVRSHRPPPDRLGQGALGQLASFAGTVDGLSFSPDGHWLATLSGDQSVAPNPLLAMLQGIPSVYYQGAGGLERMTGNLTADLDPRRAERAAQAGIRLYDRAGGPLHPLPWAGAQPSACAFSPDSRQLLVGDAGGRLTLVDVASRSAGISVGACGHLITAVAWSPDGQLVAAASGRQVRVFRSGDLVPALALEVNGAAMTVAFSPNGSELAAGSSGNMVGQGMAYALAVWDVASGECRRRRDGLDFGVMELAWEPGAGRYLLYGSNDGGLRRWWLAEDSLEEIGRHGQSVWSVDVSPDGRHLVCGSLDGSVDLWDAGDGRLLGWFRGHGHQVQCVRFSPAGDLIASGSVDRTVRFWEVAGAPRPAVRRDHASEVTGLVADRDGFVSVDAGGTAARWHPSTGERQLSREMGRELVAAVPEGGGRALVIEHDGRWLKVLGDLSATAEPRMTLLDQPCTCATPSADGQTLLVGMLDGNVAVWRTDSPKPHWWSTLPTGGAAGLDASVERVSRATEVSCVAWLGDSYLIAGRRDGSVLMVHLASGRGYGELAHGSPVTAIAVCLRRLLAATGDQAGGVALWDLRTPPRSPGCLAALLMGLAGRGTPGRRRFWTRMRGPVTELAFSDDGSRLVCASRGEAAVGAVPEDLTTLTGPDRQLAARAPAAALANQGAGQVVPASLTAETMFIDDQKRALAWYPAGLDRLAGATNHEVWAGVEGYGRRLHMLSVERG